MSSTSSIVELINDAFVDARTADGKRVTFSLSELDGVVTATAALFDHDDTVTDMRSWELALPHVEAERAAAFAKALRRMPLSWESMYPEGFPPFTLLDVPTLVTAQDFAQVMSSPDALHAAMARAFVRSLSPGTGPGAASERSTGTSSGALERSTGTSPGAALQLAPGVAVERRLYDIRMCLVPQVELEAHVDALAADALGARWLVTVLEKWPDDGVITKGGGPMRLHLAARALPMLAKHVDAAQLARLGVSMPPDVDAVFRVASRVVDVGAIELDASGRVIVADPYFADVRAIETGAGSDRGAGRCPVRLALTEMKDWGTRVTFARMDLRADARAATWRSTGHRFFVDAGLACFMQEAARDALRVDLDACNAKGRGTRKGDVFIALEYVDGANLRHHMKRGVAMERVRALRLLRDVARGLAAAHAVDVLHLDVKPENVLVDADGSARVGDFGLARVRSAGACIDLGAGAPSGTPAYMAPELWAGEGVCDGTDVWSFAILAHELLTGTRPFEAPSSGGMMALVLAGLGDKQLAFGGVDAPLAQLLRNGLLRDRRARPTMREIEAAFPP